MEQLIDITMHEENKTTFKFQNHFKAGHGGDSNGFESLRLVMEKAVGRP
jgi:hypothetical protein